jgi:hypothetical protein
VIIVVNASGRSASLRDEARKEIAAVEDAYSPWRIRGRLR